MDLLNKLEMLDEAKSIIADINKDFLNLFNENESNCSPNNAKVFKCLDKHWALFDDVILYSNDLLTSQNITDFNYRYHIIEEPPSIYIDDNLTIIKSYDDLYVLNTTLQTILDDNLIRQFKRQRRGR